MDKERHRGRCYICLCRVDYQNRRRGYKLYRKGKPICGECARVMHKYADSRIQSGTLSAIIEVGIRPAVDVSNAPVPKSWELAEVR